MIFIHIALQRQFIIRQNRQQKAEMKSTVLLTGDATTGLKGHSKRK